MPIKIEGLCGITVKENILYALLPNFKLQEKSTVDDTKDLFPHYPAILLEYDKLDNKSKQQIQYKIRKKYMEVGGKDERDYGLILLDHEEVQFQFADGSPSLETGNVEKSFVEMEKIYEDNPNWVKLDSSLLTGNIKDPANTNGVDLACRVSINKGSLISKERTVHEYSFDYDGSVVAYREQNEQDEFKKFFNILHVEVEIKEITIGDKKYTFTASPIVGIKSLPFPDKIQPDDGEKDYDFELTYKLTPTIPEKRIPTFHKVSEDDPAICPINWYKS